MALEVMNELIVIGLQICLVNFLGLIFAAGNNEELLFIFRDCERPNFGIIFHGTEQFTLFLSFIMNWMMSFVLSQQRHSL